VGTNVVTNGGGGGNGGRGGGSRGGRKDKPPLDLSFAATDITLRPDGVFVGKGRAAQQLAAEWNKTRRAPATANAATPGAPATAADKTEKLSEQELVQMVAKIKDDGEDATGYERRLAALRAKAAPQKALTLGNAKRLKDVADAKLDKAALKIDNLLTQVQDARHELELAAVQQLDAKATFEKISREELANSETSPALPAMPVTISVDKIMAGQFPMFDLGSASKFFEGNPEATQNANQLHANLATHIQQGITLFVKENKERWEESQKVLMQIDEENNAKKRKAAEADEPVSPERTAAATTTVNDVAPEHRAPLFPPAGGQPPPQAQQPPHTYAQAATKQVAVPTEEARAATIAAGTAARLKKLRDDAISAAILQQSAAAAVPVEGEPPSPPQKDNQGMDITS